jgi:predicted nucleic acid-binding protein
MGTLATLSAKRRYLDTNAFIYALEDFDDWGHVARELMQAIDVGECSGVTSELTLAECLIKPLRLGRDDIVREYIGTLQVRRFFSVVPITRAILGEAARLRATTGLKLPDAIHAATAAAHACDHFLTNDDSFRTVFGANVVHLSELLDS